jgi:hypothetical protein
MILDLGGASSYHALGSKEVFCHWLSHVKLSRIIVLVSVVLIIVPLITHYYLSKVCLYCVYQKYVVLLTSLLLEITFFKLYHKNLNSL